MAPVLQRPVRSLPSFNGAGAPEDVLVEVVPMTARLAYIWHVQSQPLVNKHYVHDGAAGTGKRVRADVGWSWPKYLNLAGLHNLTITLPGNPHGPALGLCLVVDTGPTGAFPIGMLTTVPRLWCTAFDAERARGFGWFLADAPQEVYTDVLKRGYVKRVATALLDCAIQAALDAGEDGTFLLHADPNGGQHLIDFYKGKVRMEQLPAGAAPITRFWRRANSEEYFHFDEVQAKAFCLEFDPRR